MTVNTHNVYARYLPYKAGFEMAYWITKCILSASLNSVTVIMEYQRELATMATWKPAVWEWSSNLTILALIPLMALLTRRYPLHWDTWRRYMPGYVLGSVAFCLIHVSVMVAVRKLVYGWHGQTYDFGHWPTELLYEYIKDVQSFFGIVITMHVYRWFIRRLQGEVSLLAAASEELSNKTTGSAQARPERFLVRMLNRDFLISPGDIDWAQAAGNYVNLHVGSRVYPLRSTMQQFEAQLEPMKFARIHRSHLVNIERIVSIEPLDSGDARVHLQNGSVVACSRRFRDNLKNTLR